MVPYKPGGGYDTYARLITPYLEEETGATVLVRNMPGGATYIALNHLYRAEPDGLTILIADAKTATLNQLVDDPKAKGIDILKLNWLARVADEPGVVALGTKSPYRSTDDLKVAERTIKFAATGLGSREQITESVLSEILGLNAEVILGFGGSADTALAVMRGELDGFAASASSIAGYVKDPELFALVHVSAARSAVLSEVPTIGELMTLSPEQLKWVERLDSIMGAGRSIATTPGTPANRVQFLRTALDKILHDTDFMAKAEKIDRPIDYLSGEEVEQYVTGLLSMPEEEVNEVKYVMLEKYLK